MIRVFTNGCFDIFHYGHLHVLREARKLGDTLIVAINTDDSVRRLKGKDRPIFPYEYRSQIIASLIFVDGVVPLEENTPLRLIRRIKPHVLVKGGDWKEKDVVGAEYVRMHGGIIKTIPLIEGISTTKILCTNEQSTG